MLAKLKKKNTYFIVKACPGLNNACAVTYLGNRYVLLDIRWMESIKQNENDWSHLLVNGHEIGHHLLGHTDRSPVRWSMNDGQKKDVYFFCHGNQNQRVVVRQTAQI